MSEKIVNIAIRPDGSFALIHDDDYVGALRAADGLELKTRRASHVEPDADGAWWADLAPVDGPKLGPFDRRDAALAAEVRWLEDHHLFHGGTDDGIAGRTDGEAPAQAAEPGWGPDDRRLGPGRLPDAGGGPPAGGVGVGEYRIRYRILGGQRYRIGDRVRLKSTGEIRTVEGDYGPGVYPSLSLAGLSQLYTYDEVEPAD